MQIKQAHTTSESDAPSPRSTFTGYREGSQELEPHSPRSTSTYGCEGSQELAPHSPHSTSIDGREGFQEHENTLGDRSSEVTPFGTWQLKTDRLIKQIRALDDRTPPYPVLCKQIKPELSDKQARKYVNAHSTAFKIATMTDQNLFDKVFAAMQVL